MSTREASLSPHHAAWLEAHPHRTRAWLKTALQEGFQVHHVDGDRDNNDPDNLVLIELTDHMLIHQGHRQLGFVFAGFQHKSWAQRLMHEAWVRRQERLREACRTTLYWLDGFKVPKGDMTPWWKSWGGGRKWMHHQRLRNQPYGIGLAEMPLYRGWMDQSDGWGEG